MRSGSVFVPILFPRALRGDRTRPQITRDPRVLALTCATEYMFVDVRGLLNGRVLAQASRSTHEISRPTDDFSFATHAALTTRGLLEGYGRFRAARIADRAGLQPGDRRGELGPRQCGIHPEGGAG